MKRFYSILIAIIVSSILFGTYADTSSANGLCGVYDWRRSADGWHDITTSQITIAAADTENALEIHGLWKDYTVYASFNPVTGIFSIDTQQLDTDKNIWLRGITQTYDAAGYILSDNPFEAKLDGEDLVYEDESAFGIFDADDKPISLAFESVLYRTVSLAAEDWTPLAGKATYTDGWVSPKLDTATSYQVVVWQNNDVPTLYAIVDPYGPDTPFHNINKDKAGSGFIVIDVSNPACVKVKTRIYSGMTTALNGSEAKMYNNNVETNYALLRKLTDQEILADLAMANLKPSIFADGVITIHNCIFGDQDSMYESYSFDETLAASATLILPTSDIQTPVISPTDNIPVTYHNLQGIPVVEPTRGNIYIRHQGDRTDKIKF